MRIMGVDEAGRGPVLGPMVIGAVVADESKISMFREMGARDSKALTPKARQSVFDRLTAQFETSHEFILPKDINKPGSNLNRLEYDALCRMILAAQPDQIFIDAFLPPQKLAAKLVGDFPRLTVVAEWKADENHPIVSAASIVAKVIRDRQIDALKGEHGEIGSGYPSDPKTKRWLRAQVLKNRLALHDLPSFIRTKWSTVERLIQRRSCRGLGDEI